MAYLVVLALSALLSWRLQTHACIEMENRKAKSEHPRIYISFTPNDNKFINGSTVTISCKAVKSNPYSFWDDRNNYPDDVQIYSSDAKTHKIGQRIKYCKTLHLEDRTPERICAINYTYNEVQQPRIECVVFNGWGKCTKTATNIFITEQKSPSLVEQPPSHINTSEGLDLNITCRSPELPRPVITWYKNGENVTRHNFTLHRGKSTLMLRSIVSDDEGKYWCRVNNLLGEVASNTTNITVFTSPKFLKQPVNQTVMAGARVMLSCHISGRPLPLIGWMRDSEDLGTGRFITGNDVIQNRNMVLKSFPLPSSSLITQSKSLSQLFTLPNSSAFSKLSTPSISAPITRPENSTSTSDTLTTTKDSPTSTYEIPTRTDAPSITPSAQTTIHGIMTTITDILTTTPEIPTTIPKRPFSGFIKQEGQKSTLFIESAKITDQAGYHCYASNALGNTKSTEAFVSVHIQDGNFTDWSNWTPCSRSCGNGSQYRNRSCTNPPPAIGGKNCTRPHNDTRNCNTKPCMAEIKPRFDVDPRNTSARLTTEVSLNCSATGKPFPEITWYKNNALITADNRVSMKMLDHRTSVLYISSLSRDDIGLFVCRATNKLGFANSTGAFLDVIDTTPTRMTLISRKSTVALWSTVGILMFLCVAMVIVVLIVRRRKTGHAQPHQAALEMSTINGDKSTFENSNAANQDIEILDDLEYLRFMGLNRHWELPRDRLQRTNDKLGSGCFGNVYSGVYTRKDGKEMLVAVKMLKVNATDEDRNDLMAELEILKQVGRHPNIVSLVGACTKDEPICIVIELIEGGNLQQLLRKTRVPYVQQKGYKNIRSSLTDRDLVKIALNTAKGMSHLHNKQCIHRDLAARNVLIGKDLVAKIADFGLARNVMSDGLYVKTTGGKVPWKWMAPEALRGLFTKQSDIWSFGILLWEIVTLGDTPYQNTSQVISLYNLLVDGYRLAKPPQCDDLLYELMNACWSAESNARPGFDEIQCILRDILNQNERVYINLVAVDLDDEQEYSV